jgi:acylglycerol lipase
MVEETLACPYREESGFIQSCDGTRLFFRALEPEVGHRGTVALLHGYNSSSEFLVPMMRRLAGEGFACYGVDYRGHGRSEGPPRHVARFDEYLRDARALYRYAGERSGSERIFLFGNSLGGLVVGLYGLLRPERVEGAILTAPFFYPAFRVSPALNTCARLTSLVCPTLRLPRQRPDQPEIITLRWWTETLGAQARFWRQAEQFQVPVLMLHGQRDDVACPRAAARLFRRFGSRDKVCRLIPWARHADLDPSRAPAWWDPIRYWLDSRA